jgi:hypothetical protein
MRLRSWALLVLCGACFLALLVDSFKPSKIVWNPRLTIVKSAEKDLKRVSVRQGTSHHDWKNLSWGESIILFPMTVDPNIETLLTIETVTEATANASHRSETGIYTIGKRARYTVEQSGMTIEVTTDGHFARARMSRS